MLILLAVHHAGLRNLMASKLNEEGYIVVPVETLEEAILQVHAKRIRPELLALDTMDQPLTLAAMDSLPSWLPVLVCSGPLDRGGPLLSQRPMTLILHKPFTVGEWVEGIQKICYKGRTPQRIANAD